MLKDGGEPLPDTHTVWGQALADFDDPFYESAGASLPPDFAQWMAYGDVVR